jgi:hypothetical protein
LRYALENKESCALKCTLPFNYFHCARESLEIFFHTVLGFPDGIPGLVMVIHTFGDYARFHPHLHAEEFIARVTQHIPEKGFHMVRYYGWPPYEGSESTLH